MAGAAQVGRGQVSPASAWIPNLRTTPIVRSEKAGAADRGKGGVVSCSWAVGGLSGAFAINSHVDFCVCRAHAAAQKLRNPPEVEL
jgi:hypothetical protein